MKIKTIIAASCITLFASTSIAAGFHLKNGNLPATSKIDLEYESQHGNCPTKFPITSAECTYSTLKLGGLKASAIDGIAESMHLQIEETYRLDIKVDKQPLPSCQNLQQHIRPNSTVVINKEGCVVQ